MSGHTFTIRAKHHHKPVDKAKGPVMASTNSGYISVGASVEDKVMPDRVAFEICFEGSKRTKDECLADYNADRARVARALAPFGLDKELTCKRYSCYSRTTRKKNAVLGYSYYAHGSIEADLASIDHAAVWQALNTCGVRADMGVSFGIKDRRAAEDELIAKAVGQARSNAQVLAEAAGVKLAGVRHISYNSDSRDYDWCVCEAAPAGAFDDGEEDEKTIIEPEPVEVSCSVDVEWWIE